MLIRYSFSAVISCDQCVEVLPGALKVAGVNVFPMAFDTPTSNIGPFLTITNVYRLFWSGNCFKIMKCFELAA